MLCMAPFIEEQLTSLLSLERAVFEIIVKPFGKIEVKAMLVLYRASHMTIQPCDEVRSQLESPVTLERAHVDKFEERDAALFQNAQ